MFLSFRILSPQRVRIELESEDLIRQQPHLFPPYANLPQSNNLLPNQWISPRLNYVYISGFPIVPLNTIREHIFKYGTVRSIQMVAGRPGRPVLIGFRLKTEVVELMLEGTTFRRRNTVYNLQAYVYRWQRVSLTTPRLWFDSFNPNSTSHPRIESAFTPIPPTPAFINIPNQPPMSHASGPPVAQSPTPEPTTHSSTIDDSLHNIWSPSQPISDYSSSTTNSASSRLTSYTRQLLRPLSLVSEPGPASHTMFNLGTVLAQTMADQHTPTSETSDPTSVRSTPY